MVVGGSRHHKGSAMLKKRLPSQLTPLADRFGLRPFYGDIHNHCALSYGHGRLDDALLRAKRQLDFVSITGHAHWPDMPVDDPRVAHIVDFHVKGFAKLRREWPNHFATLNALAESGSFTVFPGYEIHSFEHGDYTILYKDLEVRDLVLADSPSELRRALHERHPGAALAFPHHIGYRRGARGINWGSFDERLSPVLEIISMHGCSETSLTDRPFLHSMGPSDGCSTARHGLGLGHVFGVIGNTDHHSGYPGSYGHGRTCLYAPANSPGALWDALLQRRSTALTGDCCHLFIALADDPQGSVVGPASGALLDLEAIGGSFIDFIDIVHNGKIVRRITPDLDASPVEAPGGETETILVLELGWGERGKTHRWEGSLELEGGTILAVEPRWRGAEVVSPLEGEEDPRDTDEISCDGERIEFQVRSAANPNNQTSATQAIAARVRIGEQACIRARLNGHTVEVAAERLFEGALSGNLGPIDSPAYRFHPLPRPDQWQWQGRIPLLTFREGDYVYARMRQSNGQWAWTSPIFCR
jgi:hypothetical protein